MLGGRWRGLVTPPQRQPPVPTLYESTLFLSRCLHRLAPMGPVRTTAVATCTVSRLLPAVGHDKVHEASSLPHGFPFKIRVTHVSTKPAHIRMIRRYVRYRLCLLTCPHTLAPFPAALPFSLMSVVLVCTGAGITPAVSIIAR